MDFTRLMMITGMTMKELKAVPKKSLSTVIKSMKDRLENIWYPAPKREETSIARKGHLLVPVVFTTFKALLPL